MDNKPENVFLKEEWECVSFKVMSSHTKEIYYYQPSKKSVNLEKDHKKELNIYYGANEKLSFNRRHCN